MFGYMIGRAESLEKVYRRAGGVSIELRQGVRLRGIGAEVTKCACGDKNGHLLTLVWQ